MIDIFTGSGSEESRRLTSIAGTHLSTVENARELPTWIDANRSRLGHVSGRSRTPAGGSNLRPEADTISDCIRRLSCSGRVATFG